MENTNQNLIEKLAMKIDLMAQMQEEFYRKYFLKISVANKSILTQEEAADYIGRKASYLNQLTHHGRLNFIKREGQKSKYFLKKDLDEYMIGKPEDEFEDFEADIFKKWSKK